MNERIPEAPRTPVDTGPSNLALLGDFDGELVELDRRIETAVDCGERGAALLQRAILLQGSNDARRPANDATAAFELLAEAGRWEQSALAAAVASGLVFRTDDVESAVDLAVEAMMLLDGSKRSIHAARAFNAIALLFMQISAFEYSRDFSLRALHALESSPEVIADIVHYTHCVIHVEAWHAGVALPLETARVSAAAMCSSDNDLARLLLGAGCQAELAIIERPADIAELELDEGVLATAAPRLANWFRLVAARIHHERGDARRAEALLDLAIPTLATVRDDHRLVRSYELRSRVRADLGDHVGALQDSNARGDTIRSWNVQQVGRLAVQIAQRAELERTRARLERRALELAEEIDVDALTGVGSRRLLEVTLDELEGSCLGEVGVVVIDLDHFKRINDTSGHAAGDEVLRRVGEVLRLACRPDDLIARLGGEEFVALFVGAGEARGRDFADDVRERLRLIDWTDVAPGCQVRASAGIAGGALNEVRQVLERADSALYRAKRQGRDRSVVA